MQHKAVQIGRLVNSDYFANSAFPQSQGDSKTYAYLLRGVYLQDGSVRRGDARLQDGQALKHVLDVARQKPGGRWHGWRRRQLIIRHWGLVQRGGSLPVKTLPVSVPTVMMIREYKEQILAEIDFVIESNTNDNCVSVFH